VINEHLAIAPITEEGPAERSNFRRRLDPAGSLRIKLTELLELSVLLLRSGKSMPIEPDISTALFSGLCSFLDSRASAS
jgi:hypothetical protein